ncbi:hypothetical protein MAR_007336 [Mya arenaria]|uniref:MRH domain-containing protein n=1 Tax=Mya arenaria TaxID=6604 RepID=A0ABY7DIM4_MYAAR|nr:hypothetical protein MAR_007336 [Mya arenaria]
MNEFYLFTVLLITLPDLVTLKVCEYRDSCSCVFDDGSGMIDLASLARTDGMPLFQDQSSTADLFLYSYNPCKSFDEGTCTSVSACQYDPYLYVYYEIGSQNHVTFNVDGSNVVAIYASDDGARSTHVTLVCDTNPNSPPSVTVTGEGAQTNYYMQVTAPQLCAVPAPAGWGGGGLSGGSVLLIM